MKFLLSFLLLFALGASAQTFQYFPKSTTNPCGYIQVNPSDSVQWNGLVQVIAHGAGEVGDGSVAGLKKLASWGGFGFSNPINANLVRAVNLYGFIQIYIQTSSRYQYAEIDNGVRVGLNILKGDSTKLHYVGVSLGGYGYSNWAGVRPQNAKKFRTVSLSAPGGSGTANTARYIAAAKTILWAQHAIDDSVTNPRGATITNRLVDSVKAHGGYAFKTIFPKYGHQLAGVIWPAMGKPVGWNINYGVVLSMYQWQVMNSAGTRVYAPTENVWPVNYFPRPKPGTVVTPVQPIDTLPVKDGTQIFLPTGTTWKMTFVSPDSIRVEKIPN